MSGSLFRKPSDSPELARLRELAAAVVRFGEALQLIRDQMSDVGSHHGDQCGASCRTILIQMAASVRTTLDVAVDEDREMVPQDVRDVLDSEYP